MSSRIGQPQVYQAVVVEEEEEASLGYTADLIAELTVGMGMEMESVSLGEKKVSVTEPATLL